MSSGEHAHTRTMSDEQLRAMEPDNLFALMADCDYEPADPDVCDGCAAYMIFQDKGNPKTTYRVEAVVGIPDPPLVEFGDDGKQVHPVEWYHRQHVERVLRDNFREVGPLTMEPT